MQGMSVTDATKEAGVHITLPYKTRNTDEAFKQAWQEAAEIGTEMLEQEAARRAYHGVLEPVFYKGEECGQVRKYSDTLMIFLLKARKPEKYRDPDTKVAVGVVNNVQVGDVFDDIDSNIKLIRGERLALGDVRADGDAQQVDAPQPAPAEAEPEAD